MENKKQCNGLSIASLVLGIVGIVLSIILIGGILGVIGAILGLIAIIKTKPKNKMAIVGFILSVIAIIVTSLLIYILTRDTTPPTIEQIGTQVYIGEEIVITDLVKATDLNWLGQNNDNKVTINYEPIDTSKEGIKELKVIALDNSKNKTEGTIKISIVNPIISIYDYIQGNISQKGYYTYTIENYGNNSFSIKNTTEDGDYGIINFSEMTIKEYSQMGSFEFIDIMKFNEKLEITEIHRTSTLFGKVSNEYLDIKGDTAETTIDIQKKHFKDILGESNINICGKTVEQLKTETIDLREL